MKKKNKLLIALGALVILAFIIVVNQPNEYEKNFVDNGANKPYAQKIPLHEMDFEEYSYYFPNAHNLLGCNYDREIELPCDVNYYTLKDDSEPILTLKKGTKVYIMSTDYVIPIGYGWRCWPDYDEGWRYGYAFTTEDFKNFAKDSEMYYVKSAQLEEVAGAFYKANKESLGNYYTEKQYKKSVILYIDKKLCSNGAYLSDELRELR